MTACVLCFTEAALLAQAFLHLPVLAWRRLSSRGFPAPASRGWSALPHPSGRIALLDVVEIEGSSRRLRVAGREKCVLRACWLLLERAGRQGRGLSSAEPYHNWNTLHLAICRERNRFAALPGRQLLCRFLTPSQKRQRHQVRLRRPGAAFWSDVSCPQDQHSQLNL